MPWAVAGEGYPYSVISNCICFDTNTAGKVVYALRDYEIVKRQAILLAELDHSNQVIISNLTLQITNSPRARVPVGTAELFKVGGTCLGLGILVGIVTGIFAGRR